MCEICDRIECRCDPASKHWQQRAITAERLLSDSQRHLSDLLEFACEIARTVGAAAGPGSQDVEGMEARVRRDAVARVKRQAEALANVRALHAAWADGDEPEGALSAGRTLEQIGLLIGGAS